MIQECVTLQFHWQNHDNIRETVMVEQSQHFDKGEEAQAWVEVVFKRHEGECPEGWIPMICTNESEYFVQQAS